MLRILVVEDMPAQREALIELLQGEGFDVHGAATSAEALRKQHELRAEVVLLDLKLADDWQLETLRGLRAAHPSTRIIVITGLPEYEPLADGRKLNHRGAALVAGADDYLTKPVDFDALAALLGRIGTDIRSGVRSIVVPRCSILSHHG